MSDIQGDKHRDWKFQSHESEKKVAKKHGSKINNILCANEKKIFILKHKCEDMAQFRLLKYVRALISCAKYIECTDCRPFPAQ